MIKSWHRLLPYAVALDLISQQQKEIQANNFQLEGHAALLDGRLMRKAKLEPPVDAAIFTVCIFYLPWLGRYLYLSRYLLLEVRRLPAGGRKRLAVSYRPSSPGGEYHPPGC